MVGFLVFIWNCLGSVHLERQLQQILLLITRIVIRSARGDLPGLFLIPLTTFIVRDVLSISVLERLLQRAEYAFNFYYCNKPTGCWSKRSVNKERLLLYDNLFFSSRVLETPQKLT